MIHKLIDKLTETLRYKEAILLLAVYEKHKLEWGQRSTLTQGIHCFSLPESKCAALATERLIKLGFMEAESRATGTNSRHKFIRVTRVGRQFLTECFNYSKS